jgi:hypothetical protein
VLVAQADDTRQLMHRDALRNHHAPIAVDQPFLPLGPPHAPPLFSYGPSTHPSVSAPLVGPAARGGRRPTIDLVVVNRVASETADFDRDAINLSMKMNILVIGPNTELRH